MLIVIVAQCSAIPQQETTDLSSGDWMIQNAANGAVGQLVIKAAQARGIRTVNVVRSERGKAQLAGVVGDGVGLMLGDMLGALSQQLRKLPLTCRHIAEHSARMSVEAVAVKCAAFNLKQCSAEIRRAEPGNIARFVF